MLWHRSRVVAAFLVGGLVFTAQEARAQATTQPETVFWDDTHVRVVGKLDPDVPQGPVNTYFDGVLMGQFQNVETYEKCPEGSPNMVETLVNTVANTYIRPTYLATSTTGGGWGTSVVGTFSYREAATATTPVTFHHIPTVACANVTMSVAPDETHSFQYALTGNFGSEAASNPTCSYTEPGVGSTSITLTTQFQSEQVITLDPGTIRNDAFRLVGLASMFTDSTHFDANAVRWKDASGEHFMPISEATPRDQHLFSSPIEIKTGDYFELVKGTGDVHNPTGSTVRVELDSLSSNMDQVGIQGWLAPLGNDPLNSDSLDLWLEWMDAPATISSGASYVANFTVTATPPEAIPEPATLVGTLLLLVCGAPGVMRRCRASPSRATTRKK